MRLNPPQSTAVVDVPDELVDRYLEAGYTKVDEPKKAAAKKADKK